MGIAEFFSRLSGGPVAAATAAAAATTPSRASAFAPLAAETDPRQWAYGHINTDALTHPQHFNVHDTLYRWCGEVVDARTSHALLRFAEEQPEYMKVYLEMYRLGKRVREQVGTALLQELKEQLRREGDPRWKRIPPIFNPDLPLPWSRAHILHRLCKLHGIDLVRMSESHKQTAAHYSGTSAWPVYAFMQTYGPMRAPLIAVDIYPLGFDKGPNFIDPLWHDNTNAWTFEAACCFAKWYKDKALYTGMAGMAEIIAPFDLQTHASLLPLFHVFTKALLRFRERCPEDWPCYCNQIQDFFDFGADTPRQETGVLSLRDTSITEPPTPAYRAAGFGQAVPLSRSLQQTPTGHDSPRARAMRRAYLDSGRLQQRGDTDPGYGRGGK